MSKDSAYEVIEAGTLETLDGECPDCGADEMAAFDMLHISESGVTVFASYRGCMMCLDRRLNNGTYPDGADR